MPSCRTLTYLCSHVSLLIYHWDRPTGSVQMQYQPDWTQAPPSFCSLAQMKAQKNYETTLWDCLTVVPAVLFLWPLLENVFDSLGDHEKEKLYETLQTVRKGWNVRDWTYFNSTEKGELNMHQKLSVWDTVTVWNLLYGSGIPTWKCSITRRSNAWHE